MSITHVKIHPAIGIARLGNSPDEFFIGPERPWERPNPPGGFKDAKCRVKRQAARFRIFAYHDDSTVQELTAAEAGIQWTVHLANKKSATRNGNPSLKIDPGSRSLSGPNQRQVFDTGTVTFPGASSVNVPLGEIRTDKKGHLLVLGGFGKSATNPKDTSLPTNFLHNLNWYDDVSDGPVTASVKIHATGDTFDAAPAWVIAAPPKFAPGLQNVITLFDRIFQMAVSQNWIKTGPADPSYKPSYTKDVFPILQRARDVNWVDNVSGGTPPTYPQTSHAWPDPVYDATMRQHIYDELNPPGDMPMLNSEPGRQTKLTSIQFGIMTKWKDGDFTQDWVAPPGPDASITPEGLDRAALENCVGMAFYPGIEAGGQHDFAADPGPENIIDPVKYVGATDPMRLNTAVLQPGDVTAYMALPWQSDFSACGSRWWPAPRPNWVIPEGTSSYQAWDRDVSDFQAMVDEWHTLGFVVNQGDKFVETERCDTTSITLITPHLTFQDVPQGPMGMSRKTALAIVFEVKSNGADVTLEVVPGSGPTHTRLRLDAASVTVAHTVGDEIATARLWVIYETGPVGETLTDELTVRHAGGSETWVVTISANTVARKIAAAALVLDHSGSMTEDRGDGQSKYQSVKDAASIFVDVMLEGDGVGIVRFNQTAEKLEDVTALGAAGDPFDPARKHTKDILNGPGLTPSGSTSIGDGIVEGRAILNAAGAGYDVKALVVLTDGMENTPPWIADVAPQIDERTYAVGLGKPENISVPALQTISGNHGGYLLITGSISSDARFILQKYFLQILAGISDADIVLDPAGELIPGREQRIPFALSDADAGMDVILLSPVPQAIDFRLQTPSAQIIEPWRAVSEPGMTWLRSRGVCYYRIALPTELLPSRFDQGGTWTALLRIGKPREGRQDVSYTKRRVETVFFESNERRTLPYNLIVHSYSNLSLRASVAQSGFEPGARVTVSATISESGMPARPGAHAWAELKSPDGTQSRVLLERKNDYQSVASFTAPLPGVYRCRVRLTARTRAGYPVQREQTVTAAVWHGGDRDADPNNAAGGPLVRWLQERDARLCALLRCILAEGGVISPALEKRLREAGIDLAHLRKCIECSCSCIHSGAGEATAARPGP